MKGITVFETFTDIRDEYIRDAELDACLEAAPVRKREKGMSVFGRFINSGWSVAVICVLVAVSIMGGIIRAGFNAGNMPPGYMDSITGEVYLTAGAQVVEPESFFASSKLAKDNQSSIACGSGFYGEFTVSPVPTLTYAGDLRLHMPSNYTLNAVYVYDPEAPTEVLYTFETVDDLKALTAGSYYVALRITNTEGKNEYCNDYAFVLLIEGSTEAESDTEITAPEETLRLPLMDEPYEWPTFDPPASRFKMSHQVDSFGLGIYSLTAAYTQVKLPEGNQWCVMEITYGVHSGIGNRITCTLYDPQTKEVISKGMPTMLISGLPSPHTILQLEDGRIIALDTSIQPSDSDSANRFAVMAGVWMWSKIDPDTGEELEEVQLVPTGETWSYTFDLTDPPTAMKGWEYAFASYIYSLTDGEPPTLRVLVDTLFSPGDKVMLTPVIHDSFGEDDTATTGWARLQRIMKGQLRDNLWVQPETLDLNFCDFGLGNRLHVSFDPDGSLWILFGHSDGIQDIYSGTYVIQDGFITIDCPVGTNYFGISLHGTHTFERSETSVKIGDLDLNLKIEYHDAPCPADFIPLIMDFFHAYNASVDEYRQVHPESYAVMDMDGDGTDEIVVQLAWDGKDPSYKSYVFFMDPTTGKIADHTTISYSYLYEDGSFSYTFDRTDPSYGVDKLMAAGKGYTTQTLWRIYNDGSENAEYYIGDRKVSLEELGAYIAEIECEKVTWTACSWEITEPETDAYADATEDGKGAPVAPPSGGKG